MGINNIKYGMKQGIVSFLAALDAMNWKQFQT